ncbi:alanine racemase [Niveispirillum sp. BGYR6]|uniref:alanine racemase n=1 Tax=Niveispirillum sp. BGYR6 TaxID=2971249 RepID=UPI0022B97E0E|nr:alanine racemase [Niveispirillum sp. BGYR6]MDG5497852.1 alanine racemase [Niveispirillum sp. BGYR6]
MAEQLHTAAAHDAYFATLSAALHRAGLAEPVLVLDEARLAANIAAVSSTLDDGPAVRLVVKSLPCADLLRRIARPLGTDRYMVFNRAMTLEMRRLEPEADLLLGKPLPVAVAAAYYDTVGAGHPGPHWLIDTPQRLADYQAMAAARGIRLRINIEIDVGLHRGGVGDPLALATLLDQVAPGTAVTGLMGYDPHIAKLPTSLGLRRRALAASQGIYRQMVAVLRQRLGSGPLILNSAGSPTYVLHAKDSIANEVAIGSAFVKPADFDLDTLAHHQPACFIATPVLKTAWPALAPGLGRLAWLGGRAQAQFIHGGHWLADPVSPPGLRRSALFGPSSNQECWLGPHRPALRPGEWLFLRPRQSEAVFLQFGPIARFDGREITGFWPVFPVSA